MHTGCNRSQASLQGHPSSRSAAAVQLSRRCGPPSPAPGFHFQRPERRPPPTPIPHAQLQPLTPAPSRNPRYPQTQSCSHLRLWIVGCPVRGAARSVRSAHGAVLAMGSGVGQCHRSNDTERQRTRVCAGQDLGADPWHRPRLARHGAASSLDLVPCLVHVLWQPGVRGQVGSGGQQQPPSASSSSAGSRRCQQPPGAARAERHPAPCTTPAAPTLVLMATCAYALPFS